jgi:hypothetical protein
MGHFSTTNSQNYPRSIFYPSTGIFIAFVANLGRGLCHRPSSAFANIQVPSEGGSVPGGIPGTAGRTIGRFGRRLPRIMITDTALFRYPHYHKATDTPEKLITIDLETADGSTRWSRICKRRCPTSSRDSRSQARL